MKRNLPFVHSQGSFHSSVKPGFTLIELLITMTIVAILSGVGVASFMGSQKRGRDVRRQSDLNQYRIALENYSSINGGVYPADTYNGDSAAGTGIFSSAANNPISSYISGILTDPQGLSYYYYSDTSGLNYVLQACMESTNQTFQSCSNGKSGNVAAACSAPTDATCDL